MTEPPARDASLWKRYALLCLIVGPLAAHPAEKIEPIDAEFLEYLAELEGAEEDWTLFEVEEARSQPAGSEAENAKRKPEAPQSPATEQSKKP